MANYWHKRTYAQLSTDARGLAERGYVYNLSRFFDVGSGASVNFSLATNGKLVQFEYYDITSDTSTVQARLIEDATATTFGASIQAYNLNRNQSDNHSVALYSASAVSGGKVIASELVASGTKAGGSITQNKIHTLRNGDEYVMSFYNSGNQATTVHLNLGWSEDEPEHYRIITEVDGAE